MRNFNFRLKLDKLNVALQKVLLTFSEPTVISSAMMTADVQAVPKSNQKNILVQISFLPNVKINIHVLTNSVQELSFLVTKYNMAMAHGCAVSFGLGNDCSLEITLVPPSEEVYQKLQEFFESFCQL